MKKIIVLAALLAVSCCAYCQQKKDTVKKSSVKVERVDSKTFKATKQSGSRGNGYQPTGYNYIDTDGNTYEIYSHVVSRGADAGKTCYYIKRVSKKSGKEYWKKVEVKL